MRGMNSHPFWTRQHKQRKTGRLIVPAIAAAVVGYFSFHAYHGEYGIYSKYELERRIGALEKELEDVTAERAEIEKRVQLLRDGTIERDMLDEYARRELDYTRADEMVIMLPRSKAN